MTDSPQQFDQQELVDHLRGLAEAHSTQEQTGSGENENPVLDESVVPEFVSVNKNEDADDDEAPQTVPVNPEYPEGEAVCENYFWNYNDVDVTNPSKLTTSCRGEFSATNILKGCKWAPDGSCLLTNSDDNKIRIYNLPESLWSLANTETETLENGLIELPEIDPYLKIAEGGPVYDYSWYPFMNSADPGTCCFVASAGENPVHLFDAFDGRLRATYLPVNHLELVIAPHAVEFDVTGNNIYCGFRDSIKIFNLHRPGSECIERKLKANKLPDLNQPGIISCFAFNPSYLTIYACGSFQKTIGLYLEDGTVMAILTGHMGGVTHLKFSHDGSKLISGGRKDSRLIVWDMRNLGEEYQILEREVDTNQRIYFDLTRNDRYIVSGQTNGVVSVWDLLTNTETTTEEMGASANDSQKREFKASNDCVNGVSINPRTPVLATTSGQRHFCDIAGDSDDELFVKSDFPEENCLTLWKFA